MLNQARSPMQAEDQVPPLEGTLPVHCQRDLDSLRSFVRSMLRQGMPLAPVSPADFKEVLLTGATGFVGRFVLNELLKKDDVIIHCLVRSESESIARERLSGIMQETGLEAEDFDVRVRFVAGDMAKEKFGLDNSEFSDLSARIDAVLHLAAELSLASPYLRMREANLLGTRNVLELCLDTRFKHLFFASTLGIFPEYFCLFSKQFSNSEIMHQLQPEVSTMKQIFPVGLIGYPWTKLVAEQSLLHAHSFGMPLAIFRLPQTSISSTGYMNANDTISKLVAAMADVNLSPPGFAEIKNITPVDTIAEIIASIALATGRRHTIYQCHQTESAKSEYELSDFGINLKDVSYQEFKRACLARGRKSPLNGYWLLLDHFAPYWFNDDNGSSAAKICDLAITEDCPHEIRWPNELTVLVRAHRWVHDPANLWPYPLGKYQLNPNRLEDRARQFAEDANIPFCEIYPDWMLEGMRKLVKSLDSPECGIRESRRGLVAFSVIRRIRENAMAAKERKQHPEIGEEVIEKPVFILGINRTGTTFLHRLLSRDQKFSTLRTYELSGCALPRDVTPSNIGTLSDPRRELTELYFETSRLRQRLAGIHHLDIDEPEEDFPLLELAFNSWTIAIDNRVPEYVEWLAEIDHRNAYLHHYQAMQHYTWQNRGHRQAPGRWLLKTPFHLMELESLLHAYPDAMFIQTHRPPTEFMPSWISLTERIRSVNFESQIRPELGHEQLEFMGRMMRRAVEFRLNNPELEHRWIDVRFSDLVADPMKMVAKIYARLDLTLSDSASKAMNGWMAAEERRRSEETRHQYRMEDYGLTPDAIASEFKEYLAFEKQIDFG